MTDIQAKQMISLLSDIESRLSNIESMAKEIVKEKEERKSPEQGERRSFPRLGK